MWHMRKQNLSLEKGFLRRQACLSLTTFAQQIGSSSGRQTTTIDSLHLNNLRWRLSLSPMYSVSARLHCSKLLQWGFKSSIHLSICAYHRMAISHNIIIIAVFILTYPILRGYIQTHNESIMRILLKNKIRIMLTWSTGSECHVKKQEKITSEQHAIVLAFVLKHYYLSTLFDHITWNSINKNHSNAVSTMC